ncbi:MAG: gamma-glutamylcyclotransferase family protein [Woeseia sp.]
MLYAAHGSNLHPVRLSLRLPGSRFLGTGVVPGRKLRFHKRSIDHSGKCNIVEGNDSVYVSVYELSEEEKTKLDAIEGVGSGYSVQTINIPGFSECLTYIAADTHIDEALRPYSWYKELVLAGCESLGFPEGYVTMIQNISAIDDPDEHRHAINMGIVEKLRLSVNGASIIKRKQSWSGK